MELVGYEDNGDALCKLGERTFAMPELLLRSLGEKPRRRGRKPGISPAKLTSESKPAAEPTAAEAEAGAKQ
jgi:hypothetical protein